MRSTHYFIELNKKVEANCQKVFTEIEKNLFQDESDSSDTDIFHHDILTKFSCKTLNFKHTKKKKIKYELRYVIRHPA